jgi:hypothetical protein
VAKRSPPTLPPKVAHATQRSAPWHSVSIVPKTASCTAARALRGSRFLSSEAPLLPLPECPTKDTCQCTYKHHADRRAGPRRAEENVGLRRPRPAEHEHRVKRGRRRTDQ